MNVKELLMNEELMNNIVEDIDEIPEDSEVTYEVWSLGYDEEEDCINSRLLGEFADPDMAVACAEHVTLETLKEKYKYIHPDICYFSIEVETVVLDPEDENFGTMNIGTIYRRTISRDSE